MVTGLNVDGAPHVRNSILLIRHPQLAFMEIRRLHPPIKLPRPLGTMTRTSACNAQSIVYGILPGSCSVLELHQPETESAKITYTPIAATCYHTYYCILNVTRPLGSRLTLFPSPNPWRTLTNASRKFSARIYRGAHRWKGF